MKRSLLVAAVIIFGCVSFCYALETPTHMAINEYIARNSLNGFSLNSYLKDQLGIQGGIEESLDSQEVWQWLRIGGLKEDNPFWYMPYLRSANHFHNPLTDQGFSGVWGTGFLSGESSIQWSQEPIGTQSPGGHYSWYDVRDYFYKALTSTDKTTREKNFADTFRGLGQLMHLVQDLSVPEHARNDGHYLPISYERWARRSENVNINPEGGVILIRDTEVTPVFFDSTSLGNPNPLASVPIANLFDTDQYYIGTNPGVTLNNSIGLSEYANANFLSPDTMFSSNFPYPNAGDCVLYLDTRNNRQYLSNRGSGEQVDHLAVVSSFYLLRQRYFPQIRRHLPVGLDSLCYEEYASRLLRRAVGYSSALLYYFFHGEIDIVPDDETDSGYVIVNKTEEDMDGLFELYYDNTNDDRIKLWSGNFTLGTVSSGKNRSNNIDFTTPDDAKDNSNYILVFKGTMGNEAGAVTGKVDNLCELIRDIEWHPNNPDEIERNDSVTISVINGIPPYEWEVSGKGFSLGTDATGASNTLEVDDTVCGTATVTITDACANEAEGHVRWVGALDFDWNDEASAETIERNSSVIISAKGGTPPYTWSVSGHDFWLDEAHTMTSIETDTISTTLYAGDNICGTATIIVKDACENLATGSVSWVGALKWNEDNPEEIDGNSSITIVVIGGISPYTWKISGNGFNLAETETQGLSNTLYADDTACGTATIAVTDDCGETVTGYVRCATGQWVLKGNYCGLSGSVSLYGLTGSGGLDFHFELISGNKRQYQKTKASFGDHQDCGNVPATCAGWNIANCPEDYRDDNCIDGDYPGYYPYVCDSSDGYYHCFCVNVLAYYEWECLL